jgi:hypothetical protein
MTQKSTFITLKPNHRKLVANYLVQYLLLSLSIFFISFWKIGLSRKTISTYSSLISKISHFDWKNWQCDLSILSPKKLLNQLSNYFLISLFLAMSYES